MTTSVGDTVLRAVLAQANKEQNMHYPPGVYTTHFRLASDTLKDELVKLYPTSQIIIDLLRPGLDFKKLPVRNGTIDISMLKDKDGNPTYRNLIGCSFFIADDKECEPHLFKEFSDPRNPTQGELDQVNAELSADSKPITMITLGEWEYFTPHPYKKPKEFKKAKGCIFSANIIKVLPVNIPFVEVRMVTKVPQFFYGYKMLPDETYIFDPGSTIEEMWDEPAIPYLVKAVNLLFSNYLRDTEYIASAKDLRDNGLF